MCSRARCLCFFLCWGRLVLILVLGGVELWFGGVELWFGGAEARTNVDIVGRIDHQYRCTVLRHGIAVIPRLRSPKIAPFVGEKVV